MDLAEQLPWGYLVTAAVIMAGYLLSFVIIPSILLDRRDPEATLAWMLVIVLLPYLGTALYYLVAHTRVKRRTRKKQRSDHVFRYSLDRAVDSAFTRAASSSTPELPEGTRHIARLAGRLTKTSLLPGNAVEVFIEANRAYESMAEAIRSARHHVHLMTYIFRPDRAGEYFRDLLIEKARQGVQVRLLVDGFGGSQIKSSFIRPLTDAGGKFARFVPIFGRLRWRPNLRNHRKILVADGRIGFAGGLNIGEEYQGRRRAYAPWRDTHLRLEGPVVRQLQEVFAEDWLFSADEDLADPKYFPDIPPCGSELVQVVYSGPDQDHETIHAVFFSAVNEAQKSILITTPYFVPDSTMLAALKTAAWRGVDVRILLPGKSDMRLVQWAGRSYYQELLEAGVKLYEHRPGILHAKTMVIDRAWSTIGSANMDIRSFRLNFEVNVLVWGAAFAARLEQIFHRDLFGSLLITQNQLTEKPLTDRLAEGLGRALSPVL